MRFRIARDKLSIVLYFVSIIIVGSVLLLLPWSWNGAVRLSVLDSVFTATSAVCVTGLIVVDTAQFSRFGQVVIMLLIQFGGLGLVTFATLYIAMPRRKVSLVNRGIIKDMFIDEVDSNPRHLIRNIILTTFVIEGLGYVLLRYRFKMLGVESYGFSAAFHTVSAFCNAGFSTFSDNLETFVGDWTINLTIIGLIVLGGIGFVVMQDVGEVFMRTKRRLSYHSRIVLIMTGTLILVGMAVFYLYEYDGAYANLSIPGKFLAALFQSVTPRTAGFDTISQATLSLPAIAFTIFLMFTGGSPGSTAGGVKTTTIFMTFMAAFRSNEDDGSITYKGGALGAPLVSKTLTVLTRSLVIIGAALVLVLTFEGSRAAFGDLVFEVVSAFGTVGLSRGVTAGLVPASKVIIIATMFIGRIGLFAMSISRSSHSVERFAEFPRENLLLG
jgi:trk system potassium uptake protein TrkH